MLVVKEVAPLQQDETLAMKNHGNNIDSAARLRCFTWVLWTVRREQPAQDGRGTRIGSIYCFGNPARMLPRLASHERKTRPWLWTGSVLDMRNHELFFGVYSTSGDMILHDRNMMCSPDQTQPVIIENRLGTADDTTPQVMLQK